MRTIPVLLYLLFMHFASAEFSYKECANLLAKSLIMPNMSHVTAPIIRNSGHAINYLGSYERCLDTEDFDYFLV